MNEVRQEARPAFKYQIELGGSAYTLDMQWNTRYKYWTISLFDVSGAPIYQGRKVIIDELIFGTTVADGLPLVNLAAMGVPVSPLRIERADLGNSVAIYAF